MRDLPRFTADGQAQAVLDASRAALSHLLSAGVGAPVRDLARAAGIAERTFFRYFPRKEDAARPYLKAGVDRVVTALAHNREAPLRDALVEAHREMLGFVSNPLGAAMLRALRTDPTLQAVWLQVMTDAEDAFGDAIAARWGCPPTELRVRLAAAVVTDAGQLALGRGADAIDTFAACLDLVPDLFHPPQERR